MESNGLHDAARKQLELLRLYRERQEWYYLPLAFTYGLEVAEISEVSGVPVERIQSLLAGA